MNSHNSKTESADRKETVRIVADDHDVRVIESNLSGAAALTISEDDDRGGDPYNSTGQHVVLKIKSVSGD